MQTITDVYARLGVRRVINATCHWTRFGGTVMPPPVLDAMRAAAEAYVDLYELQDAAFIRPLWKQGVGSTVHCIAGDATGIILAATITALLGFPMWVDLGVEYAAGFACGLFVFQALFMKDMLGGSYRTAVRRSFVPEWFSMNMMMAGMILVMVPQMMGRDMRAMDPGQLLYWGTMSFGVIAGFATAYPVNVWLVVKGLKHGLMSTEDGHGRHGGAPGAHQGHQPAHAGGA